MSNHRPQTNDTNEPSRMSNPPTQNTYFTPGGGTAGKPCDAGVQNPIFGPSQGSSNAPPITMSTTGPTNDTLPNTAVQHPAAGPPDGSSNMPANDAVRVRSLTALPATQTSVQSRAPYNSANYPPTIVRIYRPAGEWAALSSADRELRRRLRSMENEKMRMNEAKAEIARLRAAVGEEKEEVEESQENLKEAWEKYKKEKEVLESAQTSVEEDFRAIWDMEASVNHCNSKLAELREKERKWGQIEEAITLREESVEWREEDVFDREQDVHDKEDEIEKRIKAVEVRETAAEGREKILERREKALEERVETIKKKEEAVKDDSGKAEEEEKEPERKKRKI